MRAGGIVAALLLAAMATAAETPRQVNPRVSLQLRDVTAAEAAAQLSRASGIPIVVPEHGQAADEASGRLIEKSRFDWAQVTFAQALRQLCERYRMRPFREPRRYRLNHEQPGDGPDRPLAVLERQGVRLTVTGAQVHQSRSVQFLPARTEAQSGSLTVDVRGTFAEGDGRTVVGLENVVAVDDQGTVIRGTANTPAHAADFRVPYPDSWLQTLSLGSPHPKATKLAWLEGELVVTPRARYYRIELPLPLEGERARGDAGGQVIVASHYHVVPRPQSAPEVLIGPNGLRHQVIMPAPPYGPTMRVATYTRPGIRFVQPAPGDPVFSPYVLGVSGRQYLGNTSERLAGSAKEWRFSAGTWSFPMDEPPAKLVHEWGEWTAPERLLSVRLTDIPLPPPPKALPRPPAARAPSPRPERPYSERGGGTLLSRVELGDGLARSGVVVLGIARKDGVRWDAVRWLEADVERDGTARLEGLQPGTYRVRRLYQSGVDGRPAVSGPGRWLNEEVVVTVSQGKETTLPPLQWAPGGDR